MEINDLLSLYRNGLHNVSRFIFYSILTSNAGGRLTRNTSKIFFVFRRQKYLKRKYNCGILYIERKKER